MIFGISDSQHKKILEGEKGGIKRTKSMGESFQRGEVKR